MIKNVIYYSACKKCGKPLDNYYFSIKGPMCFDCREETTPKGWKCPLCHRINSPYIDFCVCSTKETRVNKEEIIIEFKKDKSLEDLIKELGRAGIMVKLEEE
jgi:hypothetical protein